MDSDKQLPEGKLATVDDAKQMEAGLQTKLEPHSPSITSASTNASDARESLHGFRQSALLQMCPYYLEEC